MSDYDDATARKLKEGGFKWFRMDNIFTGVLKKGQGSELVYDWTDFDRRVDFIAKIGAEPIMAVSYMPQVLDAVPNNERQSAPKDYAAWEELCFQAAQHSLQRGKRIPFWEVWNEVNTRLAQARPRGHRQRRVQEALRPPRSARKRRTMKSSAASKPTASSTAPPPAACAAPIRRPRSAARPWPAAPSRIPTTAIASTAKALPAA